MDQTHLGAGGLDAPPAPHVVRHRLRRRRQRPPRHRWWCSCRRRSPADQIDPLGRLLVTGDVGNDRAHLLIAGQWSGTSARGRKTSCRRSRNRARVAPARVRHADAPYRGCADWDRSAAPGWWALQGSVERDAQLAQKGEVRTGSGRHDQLVDFDLPHAAGGA